MKAYFRNLIWFLGAWIFILSLVISAMVFRHTWTKQDQLFCPKVDRQSITFVMGEDKPNASFFSLAEDHFLYDPVEKTEKVIKYIRDLQSLILFLNDHSETPYGLINVVVHGNMWSGLSTAIKAEGERSYPKELYKAILHGQLPTLQPGAVDNNTQVNIWACGIGKNPLINIALDMLFTNSDGRRADLYVSTDFVIFYERERGPAGRTSASYWPYFFRQGYRPSESVILNALKRKFPKDTVAWGTALKNRSYVHAEPFSTTFDIPVQWLVIYETKEERPSIETLEEKILWVSSQNELMGKIESLNIPLEDFNWTVDKIIYTDSLGDQHPAIRAIGMSTVLCILERGA